MQYDKQTSDARAEAGCTVFFGSKRSYWKEVWAQLTGFWPVAPDILATILLMLALCLAFFGVLLLTAVTI
jgi:hypothetical protein